MAGECVLNREDLIKYLELSFLLNTMVASSKRSALSVR